MGNNVFSGIIIGDVNPYFKDINRLEKSVYKKSRALKTSLMTMDKRETAEESLKYTKSRLKKYQLKAKEWKNQYKITTGESYSNTIKRLEAEKEAKDDYNYKNRKNPNAIHTQPAPKTAPKKYANRRKQNSGSRLENLEKHLLSCVKEIKALKIRIKILEEK